MPPSPYVVGGCLRLVLLFPVHCYRFRFRFAYFRGPDKAVSSLAQHTVYLVLSRVEVGELVEELLSNLVFSRLLSGFPFLLVSRFHPVYKSDPGNHLGQEVESPQSTPVLLGALCELEHHMQHPLVG